MTTSETLPAKQKHLIGVGAAIAAGCEPCTRSFVTAAREAGACERSVHLVIEKGLSGRQVATEEIASFAKNSFASPVLDAAFRAEKALLGALTQVAAAVASNAAHRVETTVESARALGATHNQILLAAQLGRTAKRGAERETDAALSRILGDAPMSVQSEGDGACGCASPCASGDGSVPGTAPQASSPKASTCGCH